MEYLLGDGAWQGTLSAVLRNPGLPTTVLATLAARAKGEARAKISRHALRARADVPRLVAAAPAITPAELDKTVGGLRYGWDHRQDPDAAQANLVTLLRAFTTSPNTRCRALAAQAFPLPLGPRHRYAEGEVPATKLVADPEVAVAVPAAHVLGAELGGLRSGRVPAQGFGEGHVEVVEGGGPLVVVGEFGGHRGIPLGVQDPFDDHVVAMIECVAGHGGDQADVGAVGNVAFFEYGSPQHVLLEERAGAAQTGTHRERGGTLAATRVTAHHHQARLR